MADTTFIDGTVIEPSWLNDVNDVTYTTVPTNTAAITAISTNLADTSNVAYGDALIGVKSTLTGGTARTQHSKNADFVSVKDFGAVGDGVADDTSAIQAAIDSGAKGIYIPVGTYKVTSAITIAQSTSMQVIRGAGKTASILQASGTFNAVFSVGSISAQSIRGAFFDLQINCNGATVQYGIYGNRIEEFDFVGVACWFTKTAGIGTSSFSYVNNYERCDLSYGDGDGLRLSNDLSLGANNSNTIRDCLFLNNTGWGISAVSGYGLRILGNTIEVNAKGGIFAGVVSGLKIHGNYFEGNGTTGVTFATPSLTVKSDIVLNGTTGQTTMGGTAFPCTGVDIRGNNTQPSAGLTSFIWDAGAVDVEFGPNFCNATNAIPAVGRHYDPQYKGYNLTLGNVSSFSAPTYITGASANVNNTPDGQIEISCPSLKIERRNLANPDLLQWPLFAAGAGTSVFRRSQGGSTLYRYQGLDVWELSCSAAGGGSISDIYGITLTAADYPELVGKQVWFGMWLYATSATCYAVPYNSVQGFNNNPTTANTWVFIAVSFQWPGSGSVTYGIARAGSSTGSVYFAAPMLCPVGFPQDKAINAIQKLPNQWIGTAAPTVGAWEIGDRVMRSPPAAGSPKAWSCTVAGSPGTWVSEGNL